MYPSAPNLVDHTEVNIAAWNEPGVDHVGFDARSQYAELFWLPILGPSTMWLLRHIAQRFDHEPTGFVLDITTTASALGIGAAKGKHSAFHRSINRLVSFDMGYTIDDSTIGVRRVLPQLHVGQVRRLTPSAQRLHREMTSGQRDTVEEDRLRATKVAITLLRLGDSPDVVEQQLVVWGVQPRIAKESVDEAWAQKARADSVDHWASSA